VLNLLDERKKTILKITVKDYIESAHPVSSRVLAKKYLLGWSPATIRNEMADLEEEGYLIQPHTSAGRIPSDRGYRFYVDFLLDGYELYEEDIKVANSIIFSVLDWESLLKKVAELMSERTTFIEVVLYPQLRNCSYYCHYRDRDSKGENYKVIEVYYRRRITKNKSEIK